MPPRAYTPNDWRSPRRSGDRAAARRRGRSLRRVVGWLLLLGVAAFLAGGIALAAMLAWASRDLPDPSRLIQREVPASTKIYDRTEKVLLYELHGEERRTPLTLDGISSYAKWATIAIEDKNFYAHRGFRLRSLVRALLVNVLRGGRAQGGSTITQQLIKNAILTSEKTYRRKFKELLLAERLEQRFTKDEILTMYFNEIPYGSTAYGIEAASQTFLGKHAKDLDLAEGAILAALPKAPTYYSPHGSHRDELVARSHFIIDLMVAQGYVRPDEAAAAKRAEILVRIQPKREAITAPHFVTFVRETLTEMYGERLVEQGGLTVVTTLDIDRQVDAEVAVARFGERNAKKYRATNAALVAIDVPTGQVLAMVGSRDFFNAEIQGQVNVARRPRQPGSSFKPIVYASAFALGYPPDTLLEDVVTTFPTPVGAYEPHNYDGKERGLVTIRRALAGSLNIPAVKVLDLVGIDRILDLAGRLGYTTLRDRSRFGLALVLGGGEVTLLEHTAAFAAFAAEGIRRPTGVILKVTDRAGNTLEEWKPPTDDRVLDAEVARTLTDVLSDNDARAFMFGASSPLAFPGRTVAAKTGTTNDWRDAWTMGYTRRLAVGVWVGNNDNRPMLPRSDGSFVAAPIWRSFLDAALKAVPAEPFTAPQPAAADKPVLRGEAPPVVRVRIDTLTGQPATPDTPPERTVERVYQELHTILRTVRRDDPRGSQPERPEDDPMYKPWEDALHAWARRNGIEPTAPPGGGTTTRPDITVTEPATGAAVNGREVVVAGTVGGARPVTRIEVRVDGIAAGLFASTDGSFRQPVRLPAIVGPGRHELSVIAVDDAGGAASATVAIDVRSDREPVTLAWVEPKAGAALGAKDFPVTLALDGAGWAGATRLEVLVRDAGGERLLANVVPPSSGPVRILWPSHPASGALTLRARLLVRDDVAAESPPLALTIGR